MNRENKRKLYEKGYYKTHACNETFVCKVCGRTVVPEGAGSNHRNHCPNCLYSLHVDINPGDRESDCGGHMEPVAVWVRKKGEWAIIERIHASDPKEALRAYARAFYQYAVENPGIFEAMLWYNKYESEELLQATEKIYHFFFVQTDKLKIDRSVADHLLRTYRAFLEGFSLLVIHHSFGNSISIEESFEISLNVLLKGIEPYERRERNRDL